MLKYMIWYDSLKKGTKRYNFLWFHNLSIKHYPCRMVTLIWSHYHTDNFIAPQGIYRGNKIFYVCYFMSIFHCSDMNSGAYENVRIPCMTTLLSHYIVGNIQLNMYCQNNKLLKICLAYYNISRNIKVSRV